MEKNGLKKIGIITLILCSLSLSLYIMEKVIFIFVQRNDFSDHIVSMASMIFLTTLILVVSKKLKIELSIFPAKFNVLYICASIIFAILFFVNPSFINRDVKSIFVLVYSSIVIPIFEELIFRGYVWNKLHEVFKKEWKIYVVSTILFALWHLGYVSAVSFRINEELLNVMIWKVITGLCFGIVLGAVRLKTHNCYSTILLHGIMNMFAR